WQFTFSTLGSGASVITNVKLRRSTDSGLNWTTWAQVTYSYFSAGDAGGNANDLKSAQIQNAGGATINTYYYRYWLGTEHVTEGGNSILQPTSGLKYGFGPQAYARMYAALPSGTTPDSASDAQLSP